MHDQRAYVKHTFAIIVSESILSAIAIYHQLTRKIQTLSDERRRAGIAACPSFCEACLVGGWKEAVDACLIQDVPMPAYANQQVIESLG
jgi:hypothetical protein